MRSPLARSSFIVHGSQWYSCATGLTYRRRANKTRRPRSIHVSASLQRAHGSPAAAISRRVAPRGYSMRGGPRRGASDLFKRIRCPGHWPDGPFHSTDRDRIAESVSATDRGQVAVHPVRSRSHNADIASRMRPAAMNCGDAAMPPRRDEVLWCAFDAERIGRDSP